MADLLNQAIGEDLTHDEVGLIVVKVFKIVVSAFSFIACLSTIALYFKSRRAQKEHYIYVVYLLLSDLLYVFQNLFPFPTHYAYTMYMGTTGDYLSKEWNPPYCQVIGFFCNWTFYCSTFWTVVISTIMYKDAVLETPREYIFTKKRELYSVLFAFGVPLLLSIGPWATDSYGLAGTWCWIILPERYPADSIEYMWSMIWVTLQYSCIWIAIIINYSIFWKVLWRVRQKERDIGKKDHSFAGNLMKYPLVLLPCTIFGSVNRIIDIAIPNVPFYSLATIQTITFAVMGFIDSYMYASNKEVWNEFKRILCCRKREQEDSVRSDSYYQNLQ